MKHLFFVTVAIGFFSVTTISVEAQTSLNLERPGVKGQPKAALKFIEGIEIVHDAAITRIDASDVVAQPRQQAITRPVLGKLAGARSIELCSSLQFKYALMIDQEAESITNISLYNFIDSWWATRYQYGGIGRGGIDCSAFTGKLLSEVYGIAVPRTARDQYKISEKLAPEELVEGDLVFFNTRGGISHVGLYLGNNYFVHTGVHEGVTISNLTDDYYSSKFISGGRITPATITKVQFAKEPVMPPGEVGDY